MKLIVEIELEGRSLDSFLKIPEFMSKTHPGFVSVDRDYLKVDDTDDSFHLFKLVGYIE